MWTGRIIESFEMRRRMCDTYRCMMTRVGKVRAVNKVGHLLLVIALKFVQRFYMLICQYLLLVLCEALFACLVTGHKWFWTYCTCTYLGGIHILAELAPPQVR